jgi:hypothetical protein
VAWRTAPVEGALEGEAPGPRTRWGFELRQRLIRIAVRGAMIRPSSIDVQATGLVQMKNGSPGMSPKRWRSASENDEA